MQRTLNFLGKGYAYFWVIAILATILYAPFFHNAIVFDDRNLFTTGAVFDFAQTPFSLAPRQFPYFTLGFIQLIFGSIEANRIASLVLHIGCAWMIFCLVRSMLKSRSLDYENPNTINLIAVFSAIFFVLNPVAVYGAGYLVQRTILLATLFGLLSMWFYLRGVTEGRIQLAVLAVVFYGAAVLCKEHAIMLPFATLALSFVCASTNEKTFRSSAKYASIFIGLCAPVGLWVYNYAKANVGLEPTADAIEKQFNLVQIDWQTSLHTQALAFFKYLYFWFIPDVSKLSADMRIDFAPAGYNNIYSVAVTLFALTPLAAGFFILKSRPGARHPFFKNSKIFWFGVWYCWILFLTEIVTIRNQEPFVLYRSYLWAPGYVLMLTGLLVGMREQWLRKALFLCAPIMAVAFIFLAQNRLQSLSSDYALWQDAAAKLSSAQVRGAGRIFYNRGLGAFKLKQYNFAVRNFTYALASGAYIIDIYYIRGISYVNLHEYRAALADFDAILTSEPRNARALYAKGMVFDAVGCHGAAFQAFIQSDALGESLAQLQLKRLRAKFPISQFTDSRTCELLLPTNKG